MIWAPSVALARGLLVTRVQPVVEEDGGEQHNSLDDVLHLAVDVHDGESVEQGADKDAAHHNAEHAASASDQADAADDDNQHDIEDHRALRDRHLNASS